MVRPSSRAAILSALIIMAAGPAQAQDMPGDDWDFGEDRARDLSIAAVTFDNFGVAVRCMGDTLSVVISGLPPASGERRIGFGMAERPATETIWISPQNGTSAFSLWPRSTAIDLSKGGRLSLSVPQTDASPKQYLVDLPGSDQAVGRVFKACDLTFERATDDPAPRREDLGGLRWIDTPEFEFPSDARYEGGIAAVRCGVSSIGRLEGCQVESEFPEGSGFGRAAARGAHRSGRVGLPEGVVADIGGRSINFVSRYSSFDAPVSAPPSRLPDREDVYNPVPEAP